MKARFTNTKVSSAGAYRELPIYCAFLKENSTACSDFNLGTYPADEIVYTRDQYWNKSATIPKQASVLLLNGKLDPMTSSKFAKSLLEPLAGDKKELITFDYAVHSTLSSSHLTENGSNDTDTCSFQLLVSFVENSGDLQRLDKSCASKMPNFSFSTLDEYHRVYLSTTDAYDGILMPACAFRSPTY